MSHLRNLYFFPNWHMKKETRWFIGLFVILFFCILLSFPALLSRLGSYLVVSDSLEESQAVVSLSGDNARIDETIRLIRENYADWLILTETEQPSIDPEAPDTNSTLEKRKQALSAGIPEGDILVTTDQTDSTLDEAIAVRKLMQNRYLTSCIVVTDPYHARRTKLIFSDVFRQSDIRVIIHPVAEHWYRPRTWFLSLHGWRITTLEYLKLFAYSIGMRQ